MMMIMMCYFYIDHITVVFPTTAT